MATGRAGGGAPGGKGTGGGTPGGKGASKKRRKKIGVLYLVIPVTGGKVMDVAKFGFGRAPVDCQDFVEFVKKHSERYGTAFKDDKIILYAN